MKIVLLGYMGCGKSIIGAFLAKKLNVPFIDLDHEIEKYTQQTITEIFQSKGEIYFRKIEHEVFKTLVNKPDEFVLSLGGGTPCYYNNHELLQNEGVVSIYLKASVDTLVSRLSNEKENRPLLHMHDENSLKDFINKHLFERNYYYYQATKTIVVDNKSVNQIVDEIASILA